MVDDKQLVAAIHRLDDLLEDDRGQELEPHFDYGEGEVEARTLQVRRACRSLALARRLLVDEQSGVHQDRFFSSVIELSFNAVERTCQAALLDIQYLEEDDTSDWTHATVLRESWRSGAWSEEIAIQVEALHRKNRSKFYYRNGKATRERADAMLVLAQRLHSLGVAKSKALRPLCVCR